MLNGFSKAWAMTGWRLGWMVHPQNLVEPMAVLAECNNTGATVFAQYGGIAALEQGEEFVAEFNARCIRNAELVMTTLGRHPRVRMLRAGGRLLRLPQDRGGDRQPGLRPPRAGRGQGRDRGGLHLRPGQRGSCPPVLRDRHRAARRGAAPDPGASWTADGGSVVRHHLAFCCCCCWPFCGRHRPPPRPRANG